MYLSQRGMVPSLKRALNGQAKPFILGRVAMVPVKDTKGLDGKADHGHGDAEDGSLRMGAEGWTGREASLRLGLRSVRGG
jgi:hypothetical protein